MVAGVKRSAPSLGAPFEPEIPSSPPKMSKKRHVSRPSPTPTRQTPNRQTPTRQDARLRYPSPMPTSSLGLPSSPPIQQTSPVRPRARPSTLHRSHSTVSERAPLGALPEILIPESGEPILLGRSKNSSHYQLSFNRHVSRIHVKLEYVLSTLKPTILIECIGANGAKIHCDGHAFELKQGDKFTSETVDADIILDIMDSRVLVKWPRCAREASAATTTTLPPSSLWDENDGRVSASPRRSFVGKDLSADFSPPSSPTPRPRANAPIMKSSMMNESTVTVYEDGSDAIEDDEQLPPPPPPKTKVSPARGRENDDSSSELSELDLDSDDENDNQSKFMFSFGPGSDLPPMSTFVRPNKPASASVSGRKKKAERVEKIEKVEKVENVEKPRLDQIPLKSESPPAVDSRDNGFSSGTSKALVNHVSNQLAFARVSSTPLSDLFTNLPPSILEQQDVTKEKLAGLLCTVAWIGEVRRTGKDAAGKPLESEFYYIPDKDIDAERKTAMGTLRKPGLRNCRKIHKQYFWRKPKLP
ncbi:hypothetical protein DFH27DRAFT_528605 [Peziza echinospora]|nr:hypothetical protein DFH27DRAFT_528605 [Peziza echinospora]